MPFGPRLLQIPGSPAGGNNRPVPAASMFSTPADLADALSGSVQVPSRSPDQATEGVDVLQTALTRDRLGEFQAQAAIAALHADARTAEETDWVQIVEWYDELVRLTDSPVARLNRAVAVGEADGPRAGLAALAGLDPALPRHAAVAAYLHERDGDPVTAARLYAEAARSAPSLPERDHLTRQAARLNAQLRS